MTSAEGVSVHMLPVNPAFQGERHRRRGLSLRKRSVRRRGHPPSCPTSFDAMQRPPLSRAFFLVIVLATWQQAWAGRDCDAPTAAWQPRTAVQALAERNGWHLDRLKIDDGCYEVVGRDAEGRRFKAKIDPASLQVIGLKREHGERLRQREQEREREHDREPAQQPASAPTPP
ncbi:PepSY domain-containing protein [Ideonella sp. YS5]|uniref:PepSY domain-containing protein n=1 Tax=Ideonella sp. YS5 TaxID=3453714 RepID=UPI003EEE8F59